MKLKGSTTKITIILIFLIVLVVGYYAYLSGKSVSAQRDSVMTAVEEVLARDMEYDYPATPKEVIKYYNEIMKCFYNEECTDEEIDDLGRRSLELFDEELRANNEESAYLTRLHGEVSTYQEKGRKIASVNLASSTSVEKYTVDGYNFARISCSYTLSEDGSKGTTIMVYLLREDVGHKWRIYGWETADALNQSIDQSTIISSNS